MIKDFSKNSLLPDWVVCNWCGAEMLVDCDADVCPVCHSKGYLMDIEQEVKL